MANGITLRELQEHLPWSIAYTGSFLRDQRDEGHRYLMHDILHVVKGLGRLAAIAEKVDHNGRLPNNVSPETIADEVVDLVICAIHIAKTNPAGPFDIEDAVVKKIDARNGTNIHAEIAAQRLLGRGEGQDAKA